MEAGKHEKKSKENGRKERSWERNLEKMGAKKKG